MANWQDDLKRGNKGESTIKKAFPFLEKQGRTDVDFRIPLLGTLLEVKTDYFDPQLTENFFLEKYSSIEDKKLGGPWQAAAKGATHLLYWYPKTGDCYIFANLPKLIKFLDVYILPLKPVRVLNKGYTTVGYKINREVLAFAYRHFKLDEEKL